MIADLTEAFPVEVAEYYDAIVWQDSPDGAIAYRAARTEQGDLQTHWIMAEGSGEAAIEAPAYGELGWIPAGEAFAVGVPWRMFM